MHGIKLLYNVNAPAHKSQLVLDYLSKENSQNFATPAILPGILHHVFFFPCFAHFKQSLSGCKINPHSALGSAIFHFQCLDHVPKEDNKHGSGFFLTCQDFGRMLDNSFPACTFIYIFLKEINSHTLIPLFRTGSVHSGSVS